jgi:serine/threonine protein kinase
MMPFPIPSPEGLQNALKLAEPPEHIGTGGFKAVYRMETSSGPEAIKAVFVPSVGDESDDAARAQLIARAEREIEALGKCTSPVLVKLGSLQPQLHTVEGHDYLIYGEEHLPGELLSSWIARAPRPSFLEILTVFRSLVDLIRALSDDGYLHRDIKPANIMETGLPDRPFVVLDLGIAFKMHGTELTQGNSPPGTLRYMAPELLKPDYKDVMDFRCDLYAAGLTMYVVASGVHPFAPRPEHEYATAYRIMVQRPQPLAELRPDLPHRFCAIIDRCIRKKPALRYAKLDLIEQALEEVTK